RSADLGARGGRPDPGPGCGARPVWPVPRHVSRRIDLGRVCARAGPPGRLRPRAGRSGPIRGPGRARRSATLCPAREPRTGSACRRRRPDAALARCAVVLLDGGARAMKGVILAGGTGSRLYPLTRVSNKHLLPVGREPMIYHPIKKLLGTGIRDILIVTGTEHMGDVVGLLGSGREFECEFTYRVQDQAGGIAEALGLARGFARGEGVVVILGDNIFEDALGPYVERFAKQGPGARVLLKEVDDPQRFGVAEIEGERIVGIVEKPKQPKSRYCVTG